MATTTVGSAAATPVSATPESADGAVRVEQVRRFLAAWDQRPFDVSTVGTFLAPDYVDHNRPQSDPALADRDVLLGLSAMLAASFPDGCHEIAQIVAAGQDQVVVYWRFSGTHQGSFFGIAPTGRSVDFVGTDLLTIRDGQIVEHRHVEELHKVFAQLGMANG